MQSLISEKGPKDSMRPGNRGAGPAHSEEEHDPWRGAGPNQDQFSTMQATSILGFLRLVNIDPPLGNVNKAQFLGVCRDARTLPQRRGAAQLILNMSAADANHFLDRASIFNNIMAACPFQ